eukprot:279656-Pelagomonas_calceolata.AAC.2
MTLADTAGSPSHYWNPKSINQSISDTIFSGASTHHTTTLTSSSNNYHICSVLGNTSASATAFLTSPIKVHPTFFPASLPYKMFSQCQCNPPLGP